MNVTHVNNFMKNRFCFLRSNIFIFIFLMLFVATAHADDPKFEEFEYLGRFPAADNTKEKLDCYSAFRLALATDEQGNHDGTSRATEVQVCCPVGQIPAPESLSNDRGARVCMAPDPRYSQACQNSSLCIYERHTCVQNGSGTSFQMCCPIGQQPICESFNDPTKARCRRDSGSPIEDQLTLLEDPLVDVAATLPLELLSTSPAATSFSASSLEQETVTQAELTEFSDSYAQVRLGQEPEPIQLSFSNLEEALLTPSLENEENLCSVNSNQSGNSPEGCFANVLSKFINSPGTIEFLGRVGFEVATAVLCCSTRRKPSAVVSSAQLACGMLFNEEKNATGFGACVSYVIAAVDTSLEDLCDYKNPSGYGRIKGFFKALLKGGSYTIERKGPAPLVVTVSR